MKPPAPCAEAGAEAAFWGPSIFLQRQVAGACLRGADPTGGSSLPRWPVLRASALESG